METPEKIYTIIELVKLYKEGELPEDEVVFKYLSANGQGIIHRDELKREAIIGGIYSTMHQDNLIGANTAPEVDQMKGMDQTKWTKIPRK